MDALLNDPVTWTSLGLVIFLVVVFVLVKPHKVIAKSLDDRSSKIRSELDNAAALRKEAEAKLADAERRQAEAEASAKEIVEIARREAEQLAKDASNALSERIKLREKLAEERISRAEAEAVRDVRLAAVDTASKAAAQILTDTLVGKAADDHFAASLEKVAKALS
ncbi:MAG TPA: ATPase [Hyphomonadaceae bacterium]|jgi:F-type H+-transporting ATPase subunit b